MQKAKHKSIKTLVVCLRQDKTRSIHGFRRSWKFTARVIQKWTLHSPQGRSPWKSYSFNGFGESGMDEAIRQRIQSKVLFIVSDILNRGAPGEDDWSDTGSGCKDRCGWEAEKRPEAKLGRVQGEKVQVWSWWQFRLRALFTNPLSGSWWQFRR